MLPVVQVKLVQVRLGLARLQFVTFCQESFGIDNANSMFLFARFLGCQVARLGYTRLHQARLHKARLSYTRLCQLGLAGLFYSSIGVVPYLLLGSHLRIQTIIQSMLGLVRLENPMVENYTSVHYPSYAILHSMLDYAWLCQIMLSYASLYQAFYASLGMVKYLLLGSHLRIQSLLQCVSFESPTDEDYTWLLNATLTYAMLGQVRSGQFS